MCQFSKVLLAIDKIYTVKRGTVDCRPVFFHINITTSTYLENTFYNTIQYNTNILIIVTINIYVYK